MAAFLYLPARLMVSNIVGTTTSAAALTVNIVPLIIALIFVGIVIFAVK